MSGSTGFDWLALVKSGITSGIKGAVSDSAEYALSWALDSMFGLEVGKAGKQQEKQQLITSLQDISSELTQIDQNLTIINDELANLISTVNEDFQKTLAAIAASNVLQANSSIQSFWQSLYQDIADGISNQSIPAGTTATFASQVLAPGSSGVQAQIDDLVNNLLWQSTSSPGLLDTWTTTLILNMQSGMPPTQAYSWLEQNFQQYVSYLYVGYSLMVMAKVRNAYVTGDPAASQTAAQNDANNYLTDIVAPNLSEAADFFVQCVHRLILSQYMVPNATNNGFIPFVSQADADSMLTSANLAAWLITRDPAEPVNPGIMVTCYYRPSQLTNGKPPSLQPSAAYPASTGKVFALQYGYQNKWYKVIDFTDAACTQIQDFADSNIVVVNYNWPTPVPTPGKAVGTGSFANIVANYYGTTTLKIPSKPTPAQISAWEQSHGKPSKKPTKPEIVAAAAGRTVIYAFAADMSGITDNLAWTDSWQGKGNSNTTTGKDSSLQYSQSSSVSGQPKTVEATLIVDGQYKDDAMSFTNSLVRPFAYSGSGTTNPSMWVFAQATIQAYASSGGAPAGYSPVPVSINTALQFPGSATVSGSALSLTNPSDSDPPRTANWTWNAFESLTVSPGEDLTLTFQITSATQKQSSFKDYDGANFPSETRGTWSVSGLTLAWTQPAA